MKKIVYSLMIFIFLTMSDLSCFSQENRSGSLYPTRDFSSLLGQIQGLNDGLLSMHFKLYEGYVKNTNMLIQTLAEMRDKGEEGSIAFGALKKTLSWEFDGMRLHELYFESLGQPQPLSEKSPLYQAIVRDFGSYAAWKKEFMAMGLIRGIGWVILYLDPVQGRLLNIWISNHDLGHLAGGVPVLVMDVWEHAYITQYGLDRSKYINAVLEALNWNVISKRF